MTDDELKRLDVGDLVRHTGGGKAYVITANYGDRVTAVATVDITNPPEWVLVSKANRSNSSK